MTSIFTSEYGFVLKSLIAARKAAGLTQMQLAALLRKPQSFVSKFERQERRLDVVEFVVICRFLSVKPEDILTELQARLDSHRQKGRSR